MIYGALQLDQALYGPLVTCQTNLNDFFSPQRKTPLSLVWISICSSGCPSRKMELYIFQVQEMVPVYTSWKCIWLYRVQTHTFPLCSADFRTCWVFRTRSHSFYSCSVQHFSSLLGSLFCHETKEKSGTHVHMLLVPPVPPACRPFRHTNAKVQLPQVKFTQLSVQIVLSPFLNLKVLSYMNIKFESSSSLSVWRYSVFIV